MLFPLAGSRLFIADVPGDARDHIPASGWIELGEAFAAGMLGGDHEAFVQHYKNGFGVFKGPFTPGRMSLILGLDAEDPGQAILRKAHWSPAHFPFRLVFPDAVTVREWRGVVVSLGEVFDEVNNVIRLQADLIPSSLILLSQT